MGLVKKLKRYKKQVNIYKQNSISVPRTKNIRLDIAGKDNKIIINTKSIRQSSRINIRIYGDNNTIVIDENVSVSGNLNIYIGNNHHNYAPTYNCEFKVGKNTTIESMTYCTFNSGAKSTVGENCMFAYGITLFDTDSHPIFDINTHQIVNYVHGINIGNHVWIGANVTILKNTQIADDIIVGWGSVVSGKHLESHCAIAGNPARKVKEGVTWDSYAYEYCQNNNMPTPHVATPEETVKKILQQHVSLCRFGDGEFDLMTKSRSLPFQKYDARLQKKLYETWNSDDENILIATNTFYFDSWYVAHSDWSKMYMQQNRHMFQKLHDVNKQYYAAELSCLYKMGINMDFNKYYALVRKIWNNQDIVLVHGAHIFDKLKHDIFDNAKSVEHIIVPNLHAFSEYDDILQRLKNMDKNKLFILICGPTATVMAYDLARSGFWALDFGHVAKDYDWFMQKRATNTTEAILDFFSPD